MLKLLDFKAAWCPPCQLMNPIIEEIEKECSEKLAIEKIDIDQNSDKANEFDVYSIPTFVLVKDNKEVSRRVGAISKEELCRWIKDNLN